jgi:hypothetical protein
MQEPTNVDGKLLRFRAGQQHAVVQGVQKTFFVDPAPPFYQLAVHDRDLPGGAAKTYETELDQKRNASVKATFRRSSGASPPSRSPMGLLLVAIPFPPQSLRLV